MRLRSLISTLLLQALAGRLMVRISLLIVLFLLARLECMPGQSQGPGSEFTIRTEVDLRSIAVRVTDRKGDEINGLTANQFSLFENGARQKISFFDAEGQPVSLGILLDVSGSMGETGKLDQAKRVLPRLISTMPPQDEMFLLRFHQQVDDAVDFTTDQSRILSALAATTATPYTTRLYDAVAMALCYMRGASHRRRALLVITDGADQQSHRSLEDLIRIVQASETQVFIIGYFSAAERDLYRRSLPHKIVLISNQEIDDPLLAFKRLADESGAECFFPWTPDRFQQALDKVAHQLRTQYTLSYYPQAGARGFRRIEVRVSKPGARVRTRRGFDWKDLTAAKGAPPSWEACEQEPLPPYPYESKITVKNGCTLYHDDFQSESSGWPNRASFHYAAGTYQIVSTGQMQQNRVPLCSQPTIQPPLGDDEISTRRGTLAPQGVLVANGPSFGNFDASVSVELRSAPLAGASAGLIFRLGGRGYYAVIVGRDSLARQWRYTLVKKHYCENELYNLLPWKELPRNEKFPIQIAVRCRGGVITILHPGDSPSQVEDHDFEEGPVGMVLYGVGRATFRDLLVDAEGGVAEYRGALSVNPQSTEAREEPQEAMETKGDEEGTAATPLAATPPTDAAGYVQSGDALRDKGDLDGAIGDYHQALHLDPKNPRALAGLQDALASKGDWNALIAADRAALKVSPNDAATHYNLGQMLENQSDLNGAIAEYREVVRLDPGNALACLSLGAALGERGDLDGAIAAYRQAVRLNPDDDHAHVTLGFALAQKGVWDGAITEYREALHLNPTNDSAHLDLGLALEQKGDLRGALEEYRTACALDPRNGFAQQNYERLSQQLNK